MKRIKSNHLWRRGATLLLAMLMLFTCVGSALPAFAEEAAGNTATVDSGDPVLADSSASGDSTGDTGTDLPDDPQRPTLPSGEDISEEAPPADESDGETVPPADSDSSEDPAAPDSGDSIPDESESEPAEQPGEGDADLPEDEQPSGEEPDPDEDEEIPENEPEDEPFEALVILDPENGAAVQAGVGEEVTFKAPVSREDVAVAYQWQRFQKPAAGSVQTEALYDYAEGETTEYWYALDDMREAEALAMNPDMLWPGIEMYYATVAALDEIGADSSDVSIAWKTPNFALEGYTISAAETESGIEVYADKDDERHVAHLNENSEWEFGEAEEKPETTGAWLNIEGANGPEYAFTVEERDYDASFRCEVTVLDEVYLEQCLSILEEQGIELTEEQRAAEQKLYSVVMSVENGKEEALPEDEPMTFSMARSMLRAAASGKPQLSADAQWIEGLDGNYQYITKDTYDRVSEWLAKGEITETQAARYWTYLRPNGYTGSTVANVLDENGKPTGTTRQYQGFDLTDGMLEVNSEWYGKTVYFRVAGSGGTGTAITIPAYTELETDENGNYIEGASGTKYKKAITFLNPYVPDAKSMYQAFLNVTAADGWLLEQDASGNPTGATKDMHIQTYIVDCDSFNADPQRYMVDAEGNYRMDSVGWGVCVSEEPDLSGKAYWVLKDYLANGYGFLAGHDTMYAYPGAYYDAFGADLDESTIDPNDGTTWYYDINSWLPGTVGYTRDGRQSNTRGGHFYMNQLMGSNKGNVYSNTTTPSDSVSMLLSTGGSHGKYEKNIMFGGEELQVEQFGYTAAQAEANAKYRTPTNYPYSFENRPIFPASLTHTNQQAAFGPIWVSYAGSNERLAEEYGYYDHSLTWNLDGKTGTNNFYLSGTGNFLMNQIGHLPKNSASILESFLFSNSVFYVSQRKQCEVCAANQHGQETASLSTPTAMTAPAGPPCPLPTFWAVRTTRATLLTACMSYSTINEGSKATIVDITKLTHYARIYDENHSDEELTAIAFNTNDGSYRYWYGKNPDTSGLGAEWVVNMAVADEHLNASGEVYAIYIDGVWSFKAAGVLDGDCLRQTVDKIDPAHPLSESLVYKDEYDFGTAFSVGDFVEGGEDKGLALKVTGLQAQPATWRLVPLSTTSMKRGELMMSLAPESAISNASAIDLSACSAETDITERGWFMSAPEVDENGIVQPDKATLLPMTTFAQMAGGNVNDAGCSPVVKVTYTVTPMFDIDDGQTETVGGDAVTSNR